MGLIASLYVAAVPTPIICLVAVPTLAAIMRVPYPPLTAFIVMISVLGRLRDQQLAIRRQDTLPFGVVGYVLTKPSSSTRWRRWWWRWCWATRPSPRCASR